jgi:hypothetical protein
MNMENTLQSNWRAKGQITHVTLAKGMGWGLMGGLVGTMVMDLLLMALTCFSIVGNTASRFFSMIGIEMAGSALVGAAVHYLIGPVVGAIFGAAVTQVNALRVYSLKKGIVLAVLYIEILSQPILATTPILLKMTAPETLQWYTISFVMHLILGIVLGVVVSQGLRLSVRTNHICIFYLPDSDSHPDSYRGRTVAASLRRSIRRISKASKKIDSLSLLKA